MCYQVCLYEAWLLVSFSPIGKGTHWYLMLEEGSRLGGGKTSPCNSQLLSLLLEPAVSSGWADPKEHPAGVSI